MKWRFLILSISAALFMLSCGSDMYLTKTAMPPKTSMSVILDYTNTRKLDGVFYARLAESDLNMFKPVRDAIAQELRAGFENPNIVAVDCSGACVQETRTSPLVAYVVIYINQGANNDYEIGSGFSVVNRGRPEAIATALDLATVYTKDASVHRFLINPETKAKIEELKVATASATKKWAQASRAADDKK